MSFFTLNCGSILPFEWKAGNPDEYGNFVPEFTDFLGFSPRVHVAYRETVVEAGTVGSGIIFVQSGSVMLLDQDNVQM